GGWDSENLAQIKTSIILINSIIYSELEKRKIAMRWKGRRVSTNVEDRRGGGARAGGISILGLIVAFVAWKFFGVDPQQAYQATKQVTSQSQPAETQGLEHPTPEQQEAIDFVGTVLADTEDTWNQVFQQQLNQQYVPPKLVLFNGVVNSG